MKTARVRKAHQEILVNGVRYHVTLDGLRLGFRRYKRSRTHWLSLTDLAEVATGQLHLNQVAEAAPAVQSFSAKAVPPPAATPPTPIAAEPVTPPPVIAGNARPWVGLNPYAPSQNPMYFGHRFGSD